MEGGNQSRRTLSLVVLGDTGEAVERHYNVDNIAYLRVMESSLKPRTLAILAVVSIVGGLIVSLFSDLLGLIVAIGFFGFVYYQLVQANALRIGTVGQTDAIAGGEETVSHVESAFARLSRETIAIDGEYETKSRHFTYRYHFVPNNIVNIDRAERSPLLGYLAFGLALIAFLAFGFSVVNINTGMLATGNLRLDPAEFFVPVVSLAVFVFSLTVLWLVEPTHVLQFTVHGGDRRVFEMAPDDAEWVLQRFGTRSAATPPSSGVPGGPSSGQGDTNRSDTGSSGSDDPLNFS